MPAGDAENRSRTPLQHPKLKTTITRRVSRTSYSEVP